MHLFDLKLNRTVLGHSLNRHDNVKELKVDLWEFPGCHRQSKFNNIIKEKIKILFQDEIFVRNLSTNFN